MLHGRRNLPFFRNLVEKASCVEDQTVLFRYTLINCFSVICLKSVSQRDTAVSSQKRPKSVMDTDNPYQVACLNCTISSYYVQPVRTESRYKHQFCSNSLLFTPFKTSSTRDSE